ncbi:TPA: phage tail tape measure protein [Escherichia coli]|nr:phage tail tape measure protein [Escherichia coli]
MLVAQGKKPTEAYRLAGYLETAWKAVADSAKWAWDSMLDIGREASLDQKISDVLRQIDEIEKNTRPGVFGLGGIGDG